MRPRLDRVDRVVVERPAPGDALKRDLVFRVAVELDRERAAAVGYTARTQPHIDRPGVVELEAIFQHAILRDRHYILAARRGVVAALHGPGRARGVGWPLRLDPVLANAQLVADGWLRAGRGAGPVGRQHADAAGEDGDDHRHCECDSFHHVVLLCSCRASTHAELPFYELFTSSRCIP
jgi:hypothetical protein